jgi:hypothetical protein
MDLTAIISPAGFSAMMFLGDNNTNASMPFYANGDGTSNQRVQSHTTAADLFANFPGGILFSTGVKCGQAMASGARSVVGGGGTVVSDTNSIAMTSGAVKTGPWANIRRLTIWNSKLADATLQALTAP